MNLEHLRDWMAGQDCFVVGCGPSAEYWDEYDYKSPYEGSSDPLTRYQSHWTIGCNRSVIECTPDFAVCIEQHDDGIWDEIRPYLPLVTFGYQPAAHRTGLPCSRMVNLPSKNVLEWLLPCETCKNTGKVDSGQGHMIECGSCHGRQPLSLNQSPFYAVAVALLMGFETIGIIGVDLTADRYGGAARPNKKYAALGRIAGEMGSRLINLAPESRLTAVPQGSWEEIRRKCESSTTLKTVH